MEDRFDVVVVGAGHAGCEAALAAARLGRTTALLTADPGAVARMSCNPAVGGLAKGHVVREIDALGGAMGRVADRTGIQFKVLNASRGPAVRGPRCQSDKSRYAHEMARELSEAAGLTLVRGVAGGLAEERGRLAGVVTGDGGVLRCRTAVVTGGTFLNGLIHVGDRRMDAGRWGEPPAKGMSGVLAALGLRLGRMKTGTPPRVHAKSINRSKMSLSAGDPRPTPFSRWTPRTAFPLLPQVDCWLTHTTEEVHARIRENLGRSPLYSGRIVGRGPRYCPSIEDKVVRFPEKARHQVFVEPEGLTTEWTYLKGLSMSLPEEVQAEIVHAIPGLERAEILRPGYAVEYDVVFPDQLGDTLETRALRGLFLAGQINGTSGYEEAAGQGLLAGINAALTAADRDAEPFVLARHEAYLGVMVDDLVTQGTEEPYRLLTSRAEHRLLLGADGAHARLTPKAVALGLVTAAAAEAVLAREERIGRAKEVRTARRVLPDAATRAALSALGIDLTEETTVAGLLRRPGVSVALLSPWLGAGEGGAGACELAGIDEEDAERVADDLRYEGFLRRERETLARLASSGERRVPHDFVYRGVPGLSLEAVEKLERHRPRTLGQAGRIPGVPPSALTLLLACLKAREKARGREA